MIAALYLLLIFLGVPHFAAALEIYSDNSNMSNPDYVDLLPASRTNLK